MASILENEKHAYRSFVKHCFSAQLIVEKTNCTNNLEELLESTFPVSTQDSQYSLDYLCFDLRTRSPDGDQFLISKLTSEEFFYKNPNNHGGMSKGMDTGLDLLVTLNKTLWETPVTNDSKIQDIVQQKVVFGPLPRMTTNGTFIDEGIEKHYVGEGLAVDRLGEILAQALAGVNSSVKKNIKEMDMSEVFPCDLIDTSHLEKKTRQFLDELAPVTLH